MSECKTFVCIKTDGEDFTLGDTITGILVTQDGVPFIEDAKPLNIADKERRDFMESAFYAHYYPLNGNLWGWEEVK